ncbi:F-box/FBD/LRR-repeat protein At1g13570-like [Phoenix dactylifera]|uniref:F-box/FBD/LRR-repeat protein At1g13570-like n=1 Tax=Phoenix dactylifera TaxID=42345 RepID=A0A8B7CEX4_PHODC|nr:F-box/FBD/LRR-repeat protein At1g13570-like [Phoenix dactylifera]
MTANKIRATMGSRSASSSRRGGSSRGGSSRGLDLISLLPDCMLITILSFLPVKDAARTSILSSRWRHLWTLAPLHLDVSALHLEGSHPSRTRREDEAWRVRATNQILSVHRGPIPSGCLWGFFLDNPDIGRWVETLIRRGIRELALCCADMDRFYPVPLPLLDCRSLLALKLSHCHFPEPPLPCPTFLNLRELSFYFCVITDDIISNLLSCCRTLHSLVITGCMGLLSIRIRSPGLRSFTLNCSSVYGNEINDLIIEDAPNLERLMIHRSVAQDSQVTILNTPRLKLLGIMSTAIKMLRMCGTYFELMNVRTTPYESTRMVGSLRTVMHSLRNLAISVNFNDYRQVKIVPELLRCFPCLEILDVQVFGTGCHREDSAYWEQQGSLDCLHHLKKSTIKGFEGHRTDLAFAKFIITKARMLEVLTLLCRFNWTRKWRDTIRRHLGLKNRASFDAQVILKTTNSGTNEFSTWDPVIYEF